MTLNSQSKSAVPFANSCPNAKRADANTSQMRSILAHLLILLYLEGRGEVGC